MRHFRLLVLLFCWSPFVLTAEEGELNPVPRVRLTPPDFPRTTSLDGQFTIYGGTNDLRSQVYHAADDARTTLLRALSMKQRKGVIHPEKGQLPIIIQLSDRFAGGADAVRGKIAVMPDDSISLQINLATAGGWNRALFHDEMVRWLLVDLMLRRVRVENLNAGIRLELPDWLHQGCLELMQYYELGRPTELFASIFRLGKTLTIDEILNADITSLDAVSMNIYRVSSCAFILMLLEQPDGVETLVSFLAALPAGPTAPAEQLERFFPVLRGAPNQLEKWWSLALANYSEPTNTELLTMQESEAQLARLLLISYRVTPAAEGKPAVKSSKFLGAFKKTPAVTSPAAADAPAAKPVFETKPITEFASFIKRDDAKELLQKQVSALARLSIRVHPFYRRVVTGYQEQMAKLATGKDRGVAEALEGLAKKRSTMQQDATATEDYLDWYEATQRTHISGKFTEYLKSAQRLELPPPHRTDPLTQYLDAMEKEYK